MSGIGESHARPRSLANSLGCYLAAPLFCLALYWRAPFIWFRIDDFHWLSLPQYSLRAALLQPMGQGTVRVLSERLYFLSLTHLFGMEAWPFRVTEFALWCITLVLIQLLGQRLTGSRAAGCVAALLWTMNPSLVDPLVWASAFNQLFIAFIFVGALYARLRGWRMVELVLYFAGFGVLEIIVVYPLLVLLYSLAHERRWRFDPWLIASAAAFTATHYFLIPKQDIAAYALSFDLRIFSTLWTYLEWTSGWDHLQDLSGFNWLLVRCASWGAIVGIGLFIVQRARTGDFRPLFLAAWFVSALIPVLPLPNHVTKYYLTTAGIGIALVAGWALVSAWRSTAGRVACIALTSVYAGASILAIQVHTRTHEQVTSEIKVAVEGVKSVTQTHPKTAVALAGIGYEAFMQSAPHRPYQLVGASKVWLLPNSLAIPAKTAWGADLSQFHISTENLLAEVLAGRARVLDVSPPKAQDITAAWLETVRDR